MPRWVSIVEGEGEVRALPVLLRRIAEWRMPGLPVDVSTPIRVKKDRFLNKPEEFARFLMLARGKAGEGGHILLLLDADDDCPKHKAAEVAARSAAVLSDRRISVVLANREFEAWFLAAAQSLIGVRGFAPQPADLCVEAERPRDAKGWMGARMPTGYGATTDQSAFAARLDLALAYERSRSFRKLCQELTAN